MTWTRFAAISLIAAGALLGGGCASGGGTREEPGTAGTEQDTTGADTMRMRHMGADTMMGPDTMMMGPDTMMGDTTGM
jgi:hypothetical protein